MSTSPLRKVMLIEDDPSMRAVLRTLLEIEGYTISPTPERFALDSILQTLREAKPDVVLLDVHLRDTSGFDVLRDLRADPEVRSARVVMSSGMDVKERCIEAGADDFLLKPFMPDELLDKLHG